MTQYAFTFKDVKVEGIFTFYYRELVEAVELLESTIEMAQKVTGADMYIQSAKNTVAHCTEGITRRMQHMQDMTKYSEGIVSREVALSAASTLAGYTERAEAGIKDLQAGMESAKVREAQRAEREADEAKYQEERARRDQRNRENDRQRREERNAYTPVAPKYPAGVTEEAMNLILQCGYRKAAAMNHPDCGGSHEKMVAINASNDYMKKMGKI